MGASVLKRLIRREKGLVRSYDPILALQRVFFRLANTDPEVDCFLDPVRNGRGQIVGFRRVPMAKQRRAA
ncbi:MAG: hypothetical protein AAFU68_02855 [Pseudomonadota bacterium]